MSEPNPQGLLAPPQLPTSEELKLRRQPLHDLLQKTLLDLKR